MTVRVSGVITETTTKAVTGVITETTTARVGAGLSETTARRVATDGGSPAIAGTIGAGTWGYTWGGFISVAPVAGDLDDTWGGTWATSTPPVAV